MKTLLISSAALALTLASAPVSAQILGGGGGLGGQLGGGLGGQLGGGLGSPISRPELPQLPTRIDRSIDTTHQGTLTTKGSRHVDTKSGNVSASRSVDGSLANTLNTSGNNATANANGSAQGSASGNANAQLIGTDAVRSTTAQAVGATRDRVQMTRDTALTTAGAARDRAATVAGNAKDRTTALVGNTRDRATNTVGAVRNRAGALTTNAAGTANGTTALTNGAASGSANGSANGAANGGLGNLALAGTGAASGQGMFAVTPGMPVTDAKGKVIGTVESVATNARGRIQQVRMTVGDKAATLPASNFSGEGNVLVSAMGKGDIKKAATPDATPAAPKN